MANCMYICPTKNRSDFEDKSKLVNILSKKIPNISFTEKQYNNEISYINVSDNESSLFDMTYATFSNVNLFNRDNDVESLDSMGRNDLANHYIYFLENNPNTILAIRHPFDYIANRYFKEIYNFFREDYFECFIFDEGIHPDFLLPYKLIEKKTNKKKSFIQKFKSFIK